CSRVAGDRGMGDLPHLVLWREVLAGRFILVSRDWSTRMVVPLLAFARAAPHSRRFVAGDRAVARIHGCVHARPAYHGAPFGRSTRDSLSDRERGFSRAGTRRCLPAPLAQLTRV